MRGIGLAVSLLAFWLALSGHYTAFLIAVGLLAVALTMLLAGRMATIDSEGQPFELVPGALTYWPWLLWQIVRSALGVARIILHPRLPISPTMTVVDASQRTVAGLVTYANSITLTPGTITTEIRGNELTVHALVREGALDVEGGVMDRRVRRMEGGA